MKSNTCAAVRAREPNVAEAAWFGLLRLSGVPTGIQEGETCKNQKHELRQPLVSSYQDIRSEGVHVMSAPPIVGLDRWYNRHRCSKKSLGTLSCPPAFAVARVFHHLASGWLHLLPEGSVQCYAIYLAYPGTARNCNRSIVRIGKPASCGVINSNAQFSSCYATWQSKVQPIDFAGNEKIKNQLSAASVFPEPVSDSAITSLVLSSCGSSSWTACWSGRGVNPKRSLKSRNCSGFRVKKCADCGYIKSYCA